MIRWFKIYVGVTLYGGQKASSLLNIPLARSLHHEYCSLACTIEIVDDVYAAIDHINLYGRHVTNISWLEICWSIFSFHSPFLILSQFPLCGSAHTDSIVTEDHEVADVFLRQVDRYRLKNNIYY
jgi:delta-1-pyrroline-5-carboxylate synthetase